MVCVPPEVNVILSLFMYDALNKLVSLPETFIFPNCNLTNYFYVTKASDCKKIKAKHIFRVALLFSHHILGTKCWLLVKEEISEIPNIPKW